jgi:hypothetical protein
MPRYISEILLKLALNTNQSTSQNWDNLDRMVVEFTNTCVISTYHHWCYECILTFSWIFAITSVAVLNIFTVRWFWVAVNAYLVHRRSWHGPPLFFSNFLFTNLFSITFLYFFIISSLFPYFNLFVSIFIQSHVNNNLHVSTLYRY